jgi:hypothetical protein
MANIARTYTVANIIQGPIDVYANIAAPTSSALPTADSQCITLDANGQPTSGSGIHLGSVEGPTTISVTEKSNEIVDDQHESPIDVAFDYIEGEVDIAMKETNLSRLQTLLASGNLGAYNALANSQVLQIGGQLDSSTSLISLLLVQPNRAVAGKFIYWLVYKCFLNSAVQLTFHRNKENVFKLKFRAVMDTTRVAGDELMQWVKTK